MAKTPEELLALVKDWGIEEETKKFMASHLSAKGDVIDVDSWIRDRRTAKQFSEQMKAYWAVEDAFAFWLERNLKRKYHNARVEITGTDKNRVIIQGQSPKGKVTGELDYKVYFDDKNPIPVEFQFAAVDLKAYDIKKNKINKAIKQNGIILFAFLPLKKFTILSPQYITKKGSLKINSRLGGKETWNIESSKIKFKDMDYQITQEDLLLGIS